MLRLRERVAKCFGDSGVNSPGRTGLAPACYNNTLGSQNGVKPLIPLGERRTQPNLYSVLTLSTSDMEH